MKKVTKLFLSVAAISVFAAGLATSAMAMTAEYDATTGKVTITAEQGDQVASAEKTLLILNNDAVTVTEADIVQIDQSEDISEVPVGELADGTYYVRVGGDGNIDVAEFTVGGSDDRTVLVGDADGDTAVTTADAAEILLFAAGGDTKIVSPDEGTANDNFYAAAYCDGDSIITTGDAAEILLFAANGDYNAAVNTEVAVK